MAKSREVSTANVAEDAHAALEHHAREAARAMSVIHGRAYNVVTNHTAGIVMILAEMKGRCGLE